MTIAFLSSKLQSMNVLEISGVQARRKYVQVWFGCLTSDFGSVVKCGLGVEVVISGVVSLVLHVQAVISRNR